MAAFLRGLLRRLFSPSPSVEPEETREPTTTERRIAKIMGLVNKVIKPWKTALASRDKIIESLKVQRDRLRERLGEYVEALEGRDKIIEDLVRQRDDLTAELAAIETGEKPGEEPAVSEEHDLPNSPGAAPITGEGSSSA